MPDDTAQTILAPVQADNSVKADAWQAFNDSANERELGSRLQGMNLPQKVKADLWEAKRGIGQQQTQIPDATQQARQVISRMSPAETYPMGNRLSTPQETAGLNNISAIAGPNDQNIKQIVSNVRSGALAMGGAGLGPEAVLAGKGLLPAVLRSGASGIGAMAGNTAGRVISGQTPSLEETKNIGIGTAAAHGVFSEAASPLIRWIGSSKTFGAKMLQQASAKAGNAPVQISPETDRIVDEIVQQGKLGGTVPKVVSDFLERVGPTTKMNPAEEAPLTYDEARILQSNASSLSTAELQSMKGKMKALMPQFAKSLSQDVQKAANDAGAGKEHAIGMQEYAAASARNRTLTKAAKIAGIGTGIAVGEQLAKKAIKAAVE